MPSRGMRGKAAPNFLKAPPPDRIPLAFEDRREFEARRDKQITNSFYKSLHNLNLLFDVFEIKRTGDPAVDYIFLAICLAEKYVSGFRSAGRGRPRKQQDFSVLAQLLADVEAVKRIKRRANLPSSDRHVMEFLTSKIPYSRRWSDYRGRERTLRNLLAKARNPSANPFACILQLEKSAQKGPINTLIRFYGITRNSS